MPTLATAQTLATDGNPAGTVEEKDLPTHLSLSRAAPPAAASAAAATLMSPIAVLTVAASHQSSILKKFEDRKRVTPSLLPLPSPTVVPVPGSSSAPSTYRSAATSGRASPRFATAASPTLSPANGSLLLTAAAAFSTVSLPPSARATEQVTTRTLFSPTTTSMGLPNSWQAALTHTAPPRASKNDRLGGLGSPNNSDVDKEEAAAQDILNAQASLGEAQIGAEFDAATARARGLASSEPAPFATTPQNELVKFATQEVKTAQDALLKLRQKIDEKAQGIAQATGKPPMRTTQKQTAVTQSSVPAAVRNGFQYPPQPAAAKEDDDSCCSCFPCFRK